MIKEGAPRARKMRTKRDGLSERKISAKFKIGDPLEYRVARFFIYQGFFVRRGRELYTVGNLDQATDLDVFAVRYTNLFRREVQICECKGGGEGPLDRIFWIAGVKRYVGATRATLIRKSTKWNIKDFANNSGVEIIDLPRLEVFEKAANIENVWPGASNRLFFLEHEREWNSYLPKDSILSELFHTLAGEVRFHDPLSAINFLLHHARGLSRELEDNRRVPESLAKFLLADVISHLALFCMRVAEMTFSLSEGDRNGFIEKGLTYGGLDAKLTQRIFRNAERLAAESIRFYVGHEPRLDSALFMMPKAPNIAEVQEIVKLLVDNQMHASTFAPLTDLIMSEIYLKNYKASELVERIFPYTDLKQRIDIVTDYLSVLRKIGALPEKKQERNSRPPKIVPAPVQAVGPKLNDLSKAGPEGSLFPDVEGTSNPTLSYAPQTESSEPSPDTERNGS